MHTPSIGLRSLFCTVTKAWRPNEAAQISAARLVNAPGNALAAHGRPKGIIYLARMFHQSATG
jgi:hypothetical protein